MYQLMEKIRDGAGAVGMLAVMATAGTFILGDSGAWVLYAILTAGGAWGYFKAQEWLDRHTYDYVGSTHHFKRRK